MILFPWRKAWKNLVQPLPYRANSVMRVRERLVRLSPGKWLSKPASEASPIALCHIAMCVCECHFSGQFHTAWILSSSFAIARFMHHRLNDVSRLVPGAQFVLRDPVILVCECQFHSWPGKESWTTDNLEKY